jgi:hypothetical protein
MSLSFKVAARKRSEGFLPRRRGFCKLEKGVQLRWLGVNDGHSGFEIFLNRHDRVG